MTLITSKVGTNAGAGLPSVFIFALRGPVAGNKTATAAWSNTPDVCFLAAISFTGVNQSSDGAAFVAATPANGTGGSPATITITSSTNDITVGLFATDSASGAPTTNQTSIFSLNTASGSGGMDRATTPAASISDQWTFSNTGSTWALAGIDVVVAPTCPSMLLLMGVGC